MTFTVTISGVSPDPEVYGGLAAADSYIGAMVGPGADAWRALVLASAADNRGRILRAATLYLDRIAWKGTRNGAGGTTLQWPRDGVTLADGTVVDPATVPAPIVSACFELCAIVVKKPGVLSAPDQGTNIKLAAAGNGVEVEFFNPSSAAQGTAGTLPYVVQQLVAPYLAGASGSGDGSIGFAGNGIGCSQFTPQAGYRRWGW